MNKLIAGNTEVTTEQLVDFLITHLKKPISVFHTVQSKQEAVRIVAIVQKYPNALLAKKCEQPIEVILKSIKNSGSAGVKKAKSEADQPGYVVPKTAAQVAIQKQLPNDFKRGGWYK
ncbi:hypothetical protein [Phnomibacter ginsenosidimutans]|uniref:Uncharacterized protein n=1 Tax=Phnomibacter ginsenosidimutans TaxID=2676868 RepID=A0A6I6GUS5_9BACT|nr:hypothetical protein [Phnomibacter ginsenosidimutans]QGW28899.1 hypothetical protein GLV81_13050 [Phnomibacter ginsenosidimutans]